MVGLYGWENISLPQTSKFPNFFTPLIAQGGRVFAVQYDDGVDGPARVWLQHMDIPGLAMSRSLGDSVAHQAGVISEPELFEKKLSPEYVELIGPRRLACFVWSEAFVRRAKKPASCSLFESSWAWWVS